MIHLLSTWSKEYKPLAEWTYFGNKVKYAKKHGYEDKHYVHVIPYEQIWDRVRMWLLALNSLPNNDWVFFTGTDLFITQPSYKLEDYIDNDAEFICCVDKHQVFGDCFFIKVCDSSKRLLKEILERGREFGNEQVAFSTILSRSRTYQEYCSKVGDNFGTNLFYETSEKVLNSYGVKVKVFNYMKPKKICGDLNWVHDAGLWVVPDFNAWQQDTFSLHLGGKSLHFRLGIMPYLTKEIQWD